MSTKKSARKEKSLTFVGNPDDLAPKLKKLGGSQNDDWNLVLTNQAVPGKGSAKGDCRACPRARRRTGGRRNARKPRGRGSSQNGGSTPCKAGCPCTSVPDVERKQGAETLAGHQRCRTVGAECTAESHPGLRRGIVTPGSTVTTQKRLSPCVSSLGNCCRTPRRR